MNVSIVKRNPAPIDPAAVTETARRLGLHPKLAELLYARGFCDDNAIARFLSPNKKDFYDPFLMKGMRETVDRLEVAVQRQEKIVIYGDYDADGICATAILSLYLSERGLNVYSHIPNRIGEGYGLNVDSLSRIIENCCPDLIITCDCGISGQKEVEFVLDLGVDMIVTDHHEPGGSVPDCVVVNPKQDGCDYPYDMLCGAGVAFKIVQAMAGLPVAEKYLDLACIATVADLVPLLDENRLIVQLGLKKIDEKHNLGLRKLIQNQKIGAVTSSDIAYRIAPRINAAGRMGDAYRAFELLTTDSETRVDEIIAEINEDNVRRKRICDELYEEAVADLHYEDLVHGRAIVLSHPSWEKGITGIVAARLAGDYNRPAFILVNSGDDLYKGTCRSIEGINVYDLLTDAGALLAEFGGHSQAAGFSIRAENIPRFKEHVNRYLEAFDAALFFPVVRYDLDLSPQEIDYALVEALERIEPSGNSNTRPLFRITAGETNVAPCKNNANHISVTTPGGLQIFAFNYLKQSYQLMAPKKEMVIELQPSNFGGKVIKGVMKICLPSELYINDVYAAGYPYTLLRYVPQGEERFEEYETAQLKETVGKEPFGTLVIADNRDDYAYARAAGVDMPCAEFMYPLSKNNYSKIVVAPVFGSFEDFANYDRIIFLSRPAHLGVVGALNRAGRAKVFLPSDRPATLQPLKTDKETFGQYFSAIKGAKDMSAAHIYNYFRLLVAKNAGLVLPQFLACCAVFEELGFITISSDPCTVTVHPDVRGDLSGSAVYRFIKENMQ